MIFCPVTRSQATKMTESSFQRVCLVKRQRPDSDYDAGNCRRCGGKQRPAELTIIALDDFGQVAASENINQEGTAMNKQAVCDGCGKERQVSTCSGEQLCSRCAAMAGAVTNHPEELAKMLAKRGDPAGFINFLVAEKGADWLFQTVRPLLPNQIAAGVETRVLDQIAKIIDYDDESGNGLIEALVGLMNVKVTLQAENRDLAERIKELASANSEHQTAIYRLNDALAEKDRIITSLRLRTTSDDMQSSGAAIPVSSLESHLLDIALDAMRGQITGLDPDRIAMLREAA